MTWFADEQLNLHSTLQAARRLGDWELLYQLASGVYGLLWYRGRRDELAAAEQLAVEAARAMDDPAAELGSLIHLAEALRALGRAPETPPFYERALQLARDLADEDKQGWVLTHYGDLQCDLGHPERALHDHYAQASAIYHARDDDGAQIWLSAHIANAYRQLGRPERAAAVQQEALSLSRARGDAAEVAWCQWHLALALGEIGRYEQAQVALEEAATFCRAIQDPAGLSTMLLALGRIHLATENLDAARTALSEALESATTVGIPEREQEILAELARTQQPA